MDESTVTSEYLVLSRGHWDQDIPKEEIQSAIERFYVWHGRLVEEGRIRAGQRLHREGKVVTRERVLDGPFTEAKEVIGGYWIFRAASLEEAAELAGQNPCMACGLYYEVRPIDPERCDAYKVTSETPGD